ncbi:hypothetical protein C8Q80DRAFT_772084 [Daedaleopsis nitida]|nr:hypothetical protein C8Q80DRAFT_772084 [Daedaleopsis nitida]
MRFSTVLALVASVAIASATPSPAAPDTELVARSGDGNVSLTRRAGCGSTGPLGIGHYKWYIIRPCAPGADLWCQVNDDTGCLPAVTNKIGSIEVDDPDDTKTYVMWADGANMVPFKCPPSGRVRCQANFNDRNDGPSFSLRVST